MGYTVCVKPTNNVTLITEEWYGISATVGLVTVITWRIITMVRRNKIILKTVYMMLFGI